MGLLAWLFGKKEEAVATAHSERAEPGHLGKDRQGPEGRPEKRGPALYHPEKPIPTARPESQGSAPTKKEIAVPGAESERQKSLSPEAGNLRRWKESGQARTWVEARRAQWNHQDWLALLETLKRSGFWPLHPAEVGALLEEVKQDWLKRN